MKLLTRDPGNRLYNLGFRLEMFEVGLRGVGVLLWRAVPYPEGPYTLPLWN